MITKKCICGKNFQISEIRIKNGRGKFCGKKCQYENAYRPSGLKYKIKVLNRGWFEKGQPKTNSWYQAMKKTRKTAPGYSALHKWVKRNLGKAKICENCGEVKDIQWSNKSYQYKRILTDWISLCRLCHMRKDRKFGRRKAILLFNGKLQ